MPIFPCATDAPCGVLLPHLTLPYMDGHLVVPENRLQPLVDLLMTNSRSWAAHWIGRTTLALANALAWLRHLNPRGRARRNVAHHYDLSDHLFDSFLDP